MKDEKLDDRKKIVKELKRISKVIECKKVDSHNLNNYISNYFKEKGYLIDNKDIIKIINKVKYNLSNIINECDKLMEYKDTDKRITTEDVDNVIRTTIEDNIFELTNAILNKNVSKAISIYKDLLLSGEESIKLIVMVANQFRLILQVKLMVRNGYKEREIASFLKEHPYIALCNSKENHRTCDRF